jgi:hypothetical protein
MSFRSSRGWLLVAALTIVAVPSMLVFAPHAHADPAKLDATRARELFREALALEAAGDYASALSKLQQVASFKTTPQVSFNLGVCHEKLGKLVVALGHYRLALADAEQDPALKKVAAEATRALGELEPKIPSLTLKRGKGADNASVTVDGREVSSAAIGTPMMLDPGTHNVEANADGYQTFKNQVRLDTSEKATLEIVLTPGVSAAVIPPAKSSASAAASTAPPPANASAAPSDIPADVPPPASSSSGGSGLRTAGWIALGVGVVGGITSGIFYAKRSSAVSDLNGMCGADKQSCPASARSTIDDGKSATLLGNVGLTVGAVGLVTGIILLVSAAGGEEKPAAPPASSRIRLIPASPGTWAGATLDARF